jgi:hypothetical protein
MKTELLIALFFCHWLADYTHLSSAWMLNAKRLGKPVFPILVHASVHSFLMGIVLSFFMPANILLYWNLVFFQLCSHFLIDVWKGRMNGWFPKLQNPTNKFHWYIFGFDQFLHAFVIITMVHYVN